MRFVRGLSLQLNESAPRCNCHGLGSISRSQLLHDVLHVNLDCLFADKEKPRDIAIPISPGDVADHLDLPFRQRFVADMFCQMRSDLLGNALLAGTDLADRLYDLAGFHALQQVSLSSRAKCALHLGIAGKHREQNDTSTRKSFRIAVSIRCRLDPADEDPAV